MTSSKNKPESKRKSRSKVSRKSTSDKKIDAKMLAIALIFIMLFVSYVVIFSNQNESLSKDMVFSREGVTDTYYGNVKTVDIELSKIKLTVRDASSDSTNSTENLVNGMSIETSGNFNCTYFDVNNNNRLDSEDEFVVHNAALKDEITITLKSSGRELAYYIF